MTASYERSAAVAEIRGRIDHPIIDGDGHIIEYLPLVRDILVELGGASVAERFDLVVDSGRLTQMLSPAQRRELALMRTPWWGIPTRFLEGGAAWACNLLSDLLGHWDVPDFSRVVCEAWELVEHGHLGLADFRAFTFDHPVALWSGTNPDFFAGTFIEDAIAAAESALPEV